MNRSQVLAHTGADDRLMRLALDLEDCALRDEYFIQHHLYPTLGLAAPDLL